MQEAEKVSVSFYPEDRAIVERASDEKGLKNFSAALRLIIRDYSERHYNVVAVGELPRPVDATPVPLVYVQEQEAGE